jgi:hypothetical protein
MGIKRRLKKLEGDSGGEKCSECGLAPGELTECQVEWYDDPDNQPEDEDPFCPQCGEQLIYTIRWLDLDDQEDELERRRHEEDRRQLKERNLDQ